MDRSANIDCRPNDLFDHCCHFKLLDQIHEEGSCPVCRSLLGHLVVEWPFATRGRRWPAAERLRSNKLHAFLWQLKYAQGRWFFVGFVDTI